MMTVNRDNAICKACGGLKREYITPDMLYVNGEKRGMKQTFCKYPICYCDEPRPLDIKPSAPNLNIKT